MTSDADHNSTYYRVFVALAVLLVLTIGVAFVDLGWWNTPIAMAIATAKALLVMAFFMHLATSAALTRLFAAAGFAWLAIMLGLTLADYLTRTG